MSDEHDVPVPVGVRSVVGMAVVSHKKFVLSVLTTLIASLLVWFAKISDGVYSTIIVATVGAFIASDVFERRAGTGAGNGT